ncbi:FecR family protein [Brevundimonas bacteroides]|uniref:FecR family protein n=1 Tax=Brevundimonas bacteroides TaxID=74311 RepID=UPI00068F89B5|nr:FecR domain-containing protein [Brevundimonas bacteroides]
MSRPDPRAPFVEIAAAWAEEARVGLTARRSAALEAWLDQSDLHRRAFDEVRAADEALLRHSSEPDLMALREAALRARPPRFGFGFERIAAALAALTLLVSGAWWAVDRWPSAGRVEAAPAVYRTEAGERSTVTLPDGSVATLNTASAMEVAYRRGERRVRLIEGQAIFAVAHDAEAPFSVRAGDHVVTATGTLFEVRLDDAGTRVALLEGGVRVAPVERSPRGSAVTLVPGEVLTTSREGLVRVRHADVARLAEWRSGWVSFDDTALQDAVSEMNRYGGPRIVIADAEAARMRLSGVFRTGEPDRFARTAVEALPISMSSEGGTIVLASREP